MPYGWRIGTEEGDVGWIKAGCPHPVHKLQGLQPPYAWYNSTIDIDFELATSWPTMAHAWNDWHRAYLKSSLMHFFVRYEDLLFEPQKTMGRVCSCFGADINRTLHVPRKATGPFKLGGWKKAMEKYGDPELLKGYSNEELDFLRTNLDPKLMKLFGYVI